MSEQAQGETKWRLGELARMRVHHGHASAVRLRRQQENGARPWSARTTRRPSSTSCRRSTARGTRWRFRSAKRTSFFVVITVSVDGKEAWSVRPMDFEEAPGRCDVRTNTVVPVLCLRLGTPRRCCTSRILSCNGVHALFLQSLVPPLSPSRSR